MQLVDHHNGGIYRSIVIIVQEDDVVVRYFFEDSVCHTAGIGGAPVKRIDIPEYRKHIKLRLDFFVPGTIGRTHVLDFVAGYLGKDFVCLDQFVLKLLFVCGSKLNMAVGVVSD